MSLYVCEKCKCIENTALGQYWAAKEKLCSECARGKWHGRFKKEVFDKSKHKLVDNFVEYIMNKNEKLLQEFVEYCKDKPELRFWQALRNWSGKAFILTADDLEFEPEQKFTGIKDTFYWEGKDK